MPAHHDALDTGGTLHLRPRMASVLSIIVALMALGLSVEAVLRAGWQGVLVLPVPLFLLALVWMVLWAPRVVLHEDSVEVRNVLTTSQLPFAAIQEVRLGAMLRFDVDSPRGGTTTITAWNAPALGRDMPWRREAMLHEQQLRGRRLTPQERLVHDQRRSRSAVIRQRWERWLDRRDAQGAQGEPAETTVVTRPNLVQIVVVAGLGLLVLARGLL